MKYSELDSIKHLEEQLNNFKLIININKGLRFIGLGSKKISELEDKLKNLENQLQEMKEIPQKFNDIFSEKGWIAYDTLNADLMKDVLEKYEQEGIENAEKLILDYYKPDNLKFELLRLKAAAEILKRYKFVDSAYNDYKEGKYYSVVPLLLMIIDGSVNDAVGKGFHTDKSNLDVWDSITYIDNGIEKIRSIFKTGRNKTREDKIDMPYRNGILHGMDLGYDNYTVAAKCWHFLFVIRDWILSKKTEEERKKEFEEDKRIPTLRETFENLKRIEEQKKALKEWGAREISKEYLDFINNEDCKDDSLPETKALYFLELWKEKNYGYMTEIYWSQYFINAKPNVNEIKNQFKDISIDSYKIIEIRDDASGITEIDVQVNTENGYRPKYTIRLLYEGSDGFALSRNINGGEWKIVYVQELK